MGFNRMLRDAGIAGTGGTIPQETIDEIFNKAAASTTAPLSFYCFRLPVAPLAAVSVLVNGWRRCMILGSTGSPPTCRTAATL